MSQSQALADHQESEHRAQRLERVIAALQDRTVFTHSAATAPPAPLQWAIAEFRLELRRLRRSGGSGARRAG